MLSQEEAIHFVLNNLKVSSDLVIQRHENGMEFLTAILASAQIHLPFQTASLVATEPHLRCRPSIEVIKQDCLAGKGGLCYKVNVFMKNLVEALGYDIHYIYGRVRDSIHIAMVVRNVLKHGDQFMFDAAMGYPTFELIPLDFTVETKVYSHSFLKYKFMKEGEAIVRCHQINPKTGDPLDIPGNLNNGWKKVMHFNMEPRELAFFDSLMDAIYEDVESKITPFHKSLRVIAYKGENYKPAILKDSSLLLEGDTTSLKEIKLTSSEEMLKVVEENYPSIKSDVILAQKKLDLY